MKSSFHRLTALTAVAALVALTGCKSVSISTTQYIGGPIYAPSNPALVQILNTPPTRPNVRLGEVRAEPSSDQVPVQQIVSKLREAAAQMGADAVYIVSDRTVVTGAVVTGPFYDRSMQRTTSRLVVGVAIKYINPPPP